MVRPGSCGTARRTCRPKPAKPTAVATVTILELPEDEFYFFQAFRPRIFDLDKQLPSFFLQMALVYGYTLFENYLADVIRIRGAKPYLAFFTLPGNERFYDSVKGPVHLPGQVLEPSTSCLTLELSAMH